ncbi:hypothetical protein GQ55_1G366900 [Panicum hallii var. hallii]|uniref:Uncharacterized protein n=1 Tax=Panicum hallii var. hallii TaxID=1504633 RepID=A0A2T7FBE2_9POAL|nr:hypothetical protein GQ55_1G366900 [Panicum hallii var. hallii]
MFWGSGAAPEQPESRARAAATDLCSARPVPPSDPRELPSTSVILRVRLLLTARATTARAPPEMLPGPRAEQLAIAKTRADLLHKEEEISRTCVHLLETREQFIEPASGGGREAKER